MTDCAIRGFDAASHFSDVDQRFSVCHEPFATLYLARELPAASRRLRVARQLATNNPENIQFLNNPQDSMYPRQDSNL